MNNKIKSFITKVQNSIQGYHLERREKFILGIGLCFVITFLVNQIMISPYLNKREKLIKSISRYQNDLVTVNELALQYNQNKKNQNNILQQVQNRTGQFSLFAFLEDQSEKAEVKQFVKYMKPSQIEVDESLSENIVEIQLENVTLKQLTTFLEYVESKENVVFVRRISIQSDNNQPGILDVTTQIVTYTLAK